MADLTFQKKLDEFAEKAKSFCDWSESNFIEPLKELQKAENYLTELHLSVLCLPDANVIWAEVEDLKDSPAEKANEKVLWQKCRKRFENLPGDGYREIFDASNLEDTNPVFALVSDDLADIDSDLKEGLILYEQGKFAEAFWEWKFHFQIHWGNHLIGAQKAIRNYFSLKGEI